MAKYFGTDGVRGVANTPPITSELALRLGQAAGQVFRKYTPHARPTVVIGKDTRLSGYMLESALQSGFTSMGFYCLIVGPLPTPAVAMLTRSLRADLGVMVTASHNEFIDNGIKLFSADGIKISPKMQEEIEYLMENPEMRGDFEPWKNLEETLMPILTQDIGGIFMPWLQANNQAVIDGHDSLSVTIKNKLFEHRIGSPNRYHKKSFLALCNEYKAIKDRAMVDVILQKSTLAHYFSD